MIFMLVVIKFIIGDSMAREEGNSTNKIFRTLDEQIEILKAKGLKIDNIDEAKEILLRENYFFLNFYRLLSPLAKGEEARSEDFPGFMAK